jgi:hypothetical protein
MKTKTFDATKIGEAIATLRDAGVSDDTLAELSVTIDGSAITTGNSQAELNDLLAQMPEGGSLKLVAWTAIHSRLEL